MKIALSTLAFLPAGCFAAIRGGHGQKLQKRSLKIDGCLDADFSKTFTVTSKVTVCNYENVANRIFSQRGGNCAADRETLMFDLLEVQTQEEATEKVEAMCGLMYENADEAYLKYEFSKITNMGDVWDNEYYAGGTYFNYEVETDDGDNHLKEDAARIRRTYDYEAQRKMINLPMYLNSFNPFDQEKCEIDAAYCCWVQDRQANDNNGNCNTPYDSQCIDKDPADNANFCYTDHARSSSVTHVDGGFSWYTDVERGTENIEGPIHCHGFAWGTGANDVNKVYRGNNLFYVSFYDHLHQRGYVRNAPGAPMCACLENMAVVTRADCTEIQARETIRVIFNATSYNFDLNLDRIDDLNFNSCNGANNNNNDLEAYYQRLINEGRQPEENFAVLRKSLVGDNAGQCNAAVIEFLKTKGVVQIPEETANTAMSSAMMPGMPGVPAMAGAAGTVEPTEPVVEVIDPALEGASEGGGEMPEVPTDVAGGEESENVQEVTADEPVVPDAPIPDPDEDVEPEGSDLGDEGAPCDPAQNGRDCKSGMCDAGKCTKPSDSPIIWVDGAMIAGAADSGGPMVGGAAMPAVEGCAPEGEACTNHEDCCSGQKCSGQGKDKICGAA